MDYNDLWKILKEMRISEHLTCLLRNLYADQKAAFGTGRETTNWFYIGKRVRQGYMLSPCLFNFYTENIIGNARLYISQAGIKIAVRNINSLRYTDNITLMAESKEELKSLSLRLKEESEKAGLQLNIQHSKT